MKRVRCPKYNNLITLGEAKYKSGQRLVFQYSQYSKKLEIHIGVSKPHRTQEEKNDVSVDEGTENKYGPLHVIENVFRFHQMIPLQMGESVTERYMEENLINCPVETVGPSVDMTHYSITINENKYGRLQYMSRDDPPYVSTFVDNVILDGRKYRVIGGDTPFTIGAISIIPHAPDEDKS